MDKCGKLILSFFLRNVHFLLKSNFEVSFDWFLEIYLLICTDCYTIFFFICLIILIINFRIIDFFMIRNIRFQKKVSICSPFNLISIQKDKWDIKDFNNNFPCKLQFCLLLICSFEFWNSIIYKYTEWGHQ